MSKFQNRSVITSALLLSTFGVFCFLGYGSLAHADPDPLGNQRFQPTEKAPLVIQGNGIIQVDPSTLQCTGLVTFDDIPGGESPGTSYDAVFESNGARFAERFMGQSLAFEGNFDILSGSPTSPLSLQVGLSGQNINVFYYDGTESQNMNGLGHLGFPEFDAVGEGAFAVLFDYDQSEIGFDLLGGNGGSATVNFFRRDGSLIDTIVLSDLGSLSYGFRRDGGIVDIAGISVHNTDLSGMGVDNICHDVEGVPGDPPHCNAGGPYFGSDGVPIQFDGSASFDPDGTIVSYEWDFGDGNTGSGVTPTHTYSADGFYNVTLCVTDNDGYTSCCETSEPAVPADDMSWGTLKATYR